MSKGPDEIATEITVAYIHAVGQIQVGAAQLLEADAVARFYETIYSKARELGLEARRKASK